MCRTRSTTPGTERDRPGPARRLRPRLPTATTAGRRNSVRICASGHCRQRWVLTRRGWAPLRWHHLRAHWRYRWVLTPHGWRQRWLPRTKPVPRQRGRGKRQRRLSETSPDGSVKRSGWSPKTALAMILSMSQPSTLLPGVLDAQLRRDADLTHFEYYVLAMLSEASGHTLRMTALAERTNATLPRLSHVVRRLVDRKFVDRFPSLEDGRATDVPAERRRMGEGARVSPGACRERPSPRHRRTHTIAARPIGSDDASTTRAAGSRWGHA